MFSFLVILLLAWLLAPVAAAGLAVLGVFLIPALLVGLITSIFPWIPFGLAYTVLLALVIRSSWKQARAGMASNIQEKPYQPLPRSQPRHRAVDRLALGPRERQSLTLEELEFIDGCRAVVQGADQEALVHLRNASRLADGAFLAGLVALKLNRFEEAAEYLSGIIDRERELDRYISKFGITVKVRLAITDEVFTLVEPDMRGVLLALSQAYVKQKRWQDGLVHLLRLRHLEPYDIAARLVTVEWLLQARPGDMESCEEIIRLTEGQSCDSALEAALLLDRARALKTLGRLREAWNALDKVLCSSKVRHPEFLEAVCREKNILEESTQMPDRPGHGEDGSCREEVDAT